jgi:hypothetical protein
MKKANILIGVAVGVAVAAPWLCPAVTSTEGFDFARYEVILQRKPFGEPPPEPVQPVATTPVQAGPVEPPFVRSLRMCAVTESAAGVRVGLVDIHGNPPKTYFLWLGDEQDGIKLVDADYEMGAALLEKDGVQHWIYMDGKTGEPPSSMQEGMASSGATGGASVSSRPESYVERLRKRRMALRVKETPAEQPVVAREEIRRQLQEYQMEIIRAGGELGPPLPIPLTPEMDEQLVSEGVLPPAEAAAAQ